MSDIYKKYINFLLLLTMIPAISSSQPVKKSCLEFSGVIMDKTSGKKNANVKITVTDLRTSAAADTMFTDVNGAFKFRFDNQKEFLLTFEKRGYIRKKLLLNTSFPTDNNRVVTNFFEAIFQLSDRVASNYGGELLDKPFGKIVYFPIQKLFDYDPAYASEIKRELNKLPPGQIEKLTSQIENLALQGTVNDQTDIKSVKTIPEKSKKTNIEVINKSISGVSNLKNISKAEFKKNNDPVQPTESQFVAVEAFSIDSKNKNLEDLFFKNEIEKRELAMKKTILEITDRKKVIYETFLHQKFLRKSEVNKKSNTSVKYSTENPLTSFMNVTDFYENSFKYKKQ